MYLAHFRFWGQSRRAVELLAMPAFDPEADAALLAVVVRSFEDCQQIGSSKLSQYRAWDSWFSRTSR